MKVKCLTMVVYKGTPHYKGDIIELKEIPTGCDKDFEVIEEKKKAKKNGTTTTDVM